MRNAAPVSAAAYPLKTVDGGATAAATTLTRPATAPAAISSTNYVIYGAGGPAPVPP